MNESGIPEALFNAVERDLKPVRSLASPGRRALALLPVGIVLLVGMPEFWSWRLHSALAPGRAWVFSALETLLSLVILGAGFREAVPGRQLSSRTLMALTLVSCVSFLLVNATTRSPIGISPAHWVQWLGECIVTAVTFSVPALVAPAWLVSRALPNRPALTGGLCGLGVGMMADAGQRLLCWDGDYLHVLFAHGGAILILVALGALSAMTVEHIKALRLRRAY
jgi:hypothetical protein